MKCCSSAATGFGGYSAPTIPAVGACKQVSVNAAKAVVNQFPGRIREIGCKRDCSCPGSSDHCCGLATDFMCSDAGVCYPFWKRDRRVVHEEPQHSQPQVCYLGTEDLDYLCR
ncbi:hypothetical protein LB505_012357 [Fusarium chuoi]|nr:hypothetical protein LB505_012357 [Fusarium chuoi]